jgi:hypothetical protein
LHVDGKIVAEKGENGLVVHDVKAFEQCISLPNNIEDFVKLETEQVISKELLDWVIAQRYIYEEQRVHLEPWIGIPLAQAVDMHANGIQI